MSCSVHVFGVRATQLRTFHNGRVERLVPVVGAEGAGYDRDRPPVVVVAPPPGSTGVQAEFEAIVETTGRISGYRQIKPGSGYTVVPAVTTAGDVSKTNAGAD